MVVRRIILVHANHTSFLPSVPSALTSYQSRPPLCIVKAMTSLGNSNAANAKRHRLFDTLPVDAALVASLVKTHFNVALGQVIKSSQNYTYHGVDIQSGEPKIVRVTPDSDDTETERIADELHFVLYLHKRGLKFVCPPIKKIDLNTNDDDSGKKDSGDETIDPHKYLLRSGNLNIVVSEHAKGISVPFATWEWIHDETLARIWGKWTGEFHALSRKYAQDFPEHVARARSWDELHDSIMKGNPVDPLDIALASDPKHFGLLHGDINISNFFYVEPTATFPGTLSVFDWDQCQRGWFLYDLVMCIYFPWMLSRAGKFIDGSTPCDKRAADRFTDWVVEGYQHGLDSSLPEEAPHKVDRDALTRMTFLRKDFYENFCRRGVKELEEDEEAGAPPKTAMKVFMTWVVEWLDREAKGEIAW